MLLIDICVLYQSSFICDIDVGLYILPGEFGIVYRARLGPQGRAGREVAVKTLKGCWIYEYSININSSFQVILIKWKWISLLKRV